MLRILYVLRAESWHAHTGIQERKKERKKERNYGPGPVHTALYVRVAWNWWLGHLPRSPWTGEGGDWWSWPMGSLPQIVVQPSQKFFQRLEIKKTFLFCWTKTFLHIHFWWPGLSSAWQSSESTEDLLKLPLKRDDPAKWLLLAQRLHIYG